MYFDLNLSYFIQENNDQLVSNDQKSSIFSFHTGNKERKKERKKQTNKQRNKETMKERNKERKKMKETKKERNTDLGPVYMEGGCPG